MDRPTSPATFVMTENNAATSAIQSSKATLRELRLVATKRRTVTATPRGEKMRSTMNCAYCTEFLQSSNVIVAVMYALKTKCSRTQALNQEVGGMCKH